MNISKELNEYSQSVSEWFNKTFGEQSVSTKPIPITIQSQKASEQAYDELRTKSRAADLDFY